MLGVEELTPIRWKKEQLDELIRECVGPNEEMSDPILARQHQYCRCFYESAAREWDFKTFQSNKTFEKILEDETGTEARCAALTRGVQH